MDSYTLEYDMPQCLWVLRHDASGRVVRAFLSRREATEGGHVRELVGADGVALVSGGRVAAFGHTPPEAAVAELDQWLSRQPGLRPVSTSALSTLLPQAEAWRAHGSGLLAVRLPGDAPLSILWFRSEILETVRWAGNPSTAIKVGATGALTPRASFEE